MNPNLTGQKVSLTYGQLIQKIDASYYTGLGEPIFFLDASTLENSLSNYIPNSSLGSESFYYDASGYLQTINTGGGGVATVFSKWKYKTGTSDSDPGSGYFKLNNSDPSLATFLYINDETIAKANVRNILLKLKAGDSLYVQELPDPNEYSMYTLTGDSSEGSSYVKLPVVSSNTSSSSFTNNKEFGIIFLFTGSGSGVSQEYVDSSLNAIRAEYIPDVSLSDNFIWVGGKLYVDVSSAASNVNPAFDYQTYSPRTSDVSFYYTGDSVSQIITTNDIGVKTVDFIYDLNGDVSAININNYGVNTKVVTFEKDINGNILAVHIN